MQREAKRPAIAWLVPQNSFRTVPMEGTCVQRLPCWPFALDRDVRPLCIFCLHYIVLRCRRGVFSYTSACGRGASGHAGRSSHNSGYDIACIAAALRASGAAQAAQFVRIIFVFGGPFGAIAGRRSRLLASVEAASCGLKSKLFARTFTQEHRITCIETIHHSKRFIRKPHNCAGQPYK